ncbi:MAG: proton-conducting transporter membrane subunit [Planctomycetaceae bacterium]
MPILQSCLAVVSPVLLLLFGLVPSGFANRHVGLMRRAAKVTAGLAFFLAMVTAAMLVRVGSVDVALATLTWPIKVSLGVYLDSLSAIMLLLITFIGAIIIRYSISYLDRDATQGRFLKWIAFTLGAVLLLVVSRNLVMFTAAWMLTSFGLHKLLTHYSDRSWAIWAARKKFLISRLGDVMLLAALGLTYFCFGSVEYSEIFAAAEKLQQGSPGSVWIPVIGSLYVLGAMTKSAQFPFHSWLPDTMETPTPVSALMHAGIINAGGFLILRLSPLIAQSHLALDFLALTGAFSALLGAIVMLTQTSVKRQLAYSTMAQMGFMMLQCGLGAFSAALLHIVAHSVYKAHAFLSSGSVLDTAAGLKTNSGRVHSATRSLVMLPLALTVAFVICGATVSTLTDSFFAKPGAVVLGLVLTIAMTQLLWPAFSSGSLRLAAWGVLAATAVCCGYYGAWLATDTLLASSVSHLKIIPSSFDSLVTAFVGMGFVGIFVLQATTRLATPGPLLRSLYVHAVHGFYLDVPARRVTAWAWGQQGPTQ